jgi:hypothetical protein
MVPNRPAGRLAGLCYDASVFQRALPAGERRNAVGPLCWQTLDALEAALVDVPSIQADVSNLEVLMQQAASRSVQEQEVRDLQASYERAASAAFPTSRAALKWYHQLVGLSRENSLAQIRPARIRDMELKAFGDAQLAAMLVDLLAALRRIRSVDDVQGFGQAFEFYGEAVVYCLLSAKFATRRIVATNIPLPDFECTAPSGKRFYVELKSFDVVDGVYRATEMLHEGLEQAVEIEAQVARGERIATAEGEIAPYKKAFGKPYDATSLLRVIDTLRDKARSAFKASQFVQGPTIAFALCDRLLIPAGKHSVAPYFVERGAGNTLASGVLWHACFGTAGSPIFRPAVEGHPTLEGHLTSPGLFADIALPFPTGAIFFAETSWSEDGVFGLYQSNWDPQPGVWTSTDTEEVVHSMSSAVNDEANSFGFVSSLT